jgi:hypothetical protein
MTGTTFVPTLSDGVRVAVTATTGSTAEVTVSSQMNETVGSGCAISFAVSGASTIAPSYTNSLALAAAGANVDARGSSTTIVTNLTPGVNTFTEEYSASSGTCFAFRSEIDVIPLG